VRDALDLGARVAAGHVVDQHRTAAAEHRPQRGPESRPERVEDDPYERMRQWCRDRGRGRRRRDQHHVDVDPDDRITEL
jgi:hypothetical protein